MVTLCLATYKCGLYNLILQINYWNYFPNNVTKKHAWFKKSYLVYACSRLSFLRRQVFHYWHHLRDFASPSWVYVPAPVTSKFCSCLAQGSVFLPMFEELPYKKGCRLLLLGFILQSVFRQNKSLFVILINSLLLFLSEYLQFQLTH